MITTTPPLKKSGIHRLFFCASNVDWAYFMPEKLPVEV